MPAKIPEIVNSRASKKITIEVKEVQGPGGMTMRFLEHVFDFNTWKSTTEIITSSASTKKIIFASKDNGNTWEKVWPKKDSEVIEILELEKDEEKSIFGRCFTTSTGRHLLQLSKNNKPGNIYIFDKNWEYVGKRSTGDFNWHGSFSIGEYKKTIMFSEYAAGADKLYVWRSQDDGDTWEKVFEKKSHPTNERMGEIRHFHTCFPWPKPGNRDTEHSAWLVSSGDTAKQSQVWITYNNGDTWKNITDKSFPLDGKDFTRTTHRYTSLQYLEDGSILWATDDHANPARSASLVKAELENNTLKLNVLTSLWSNNNRSLIDFGSYFLSISEAKEPDIKNAYFQVLNKQEPSYIEWAGTISCPARTGFTYSLSSIMAYENVAFSYNMLRWELKEEDNVVTVKQNFYQYIKKWLSRKRLKK